MDINTSTYQALLQLRNNDISDERARRMSLIYLEQCLEYSVSQHQTKEFLMKTAKESGRKKFKLIARVNTSGIELMEWCDEANNFDFMCSSFKNINSTKDGAYKKRTYTLLELEVIIDNALYWYNGVKKTIHVFNTTELHILAVDEETISFWTKLKRFFKYKD